MSFSERVVRRALGGGLLVRIYFELKVEVRIAKAAIRKDIFRGQLVALRDVSGPPKVGEPLLKNMLL